MDGDARILVAGAGGMLGRRLLETLPTLGRVVASTRRGGDGTVAMDIEDVDSVLAAVRSVRPTVIVNAAAYTAVDRAESEPLAAFRANGLGPRNLAVAALEADAELLHVSTDFVFDGARSEPWIESDPRNPLSVYGRSKVMGEDAVMGIAPRWYIVRTQWLYGEGGRNFVDTILRLAAEGRPLRVVADQTGAPTAAADVAEAIARLLGRRVYGLYHAANTGSATWHDLARRALDLTGRDAVPVAPISTAEYPAPARRPAFSVLRNLAFELLFSDNMRPWDAALAGYLAGRRPDAPSGGA